MSTEPSASEDSPPELDRNARELPHRPRGTPQAEFLTQAMEHRVRLHRYCTRMLGSALDGEDVVQDTLAAAFLRLDTVDRDRPLAPLLFRIAHNRCIDQLRRRRFESDLELDDDSVDRANFRSSRTGGDPEQSVILDQEAETALRRLVLLLPARERSCFVLKEVLELSIDEIAGVLGCGTGAVKSALHRARAKLQRLRDNADRVQRPLPPRETPEAVDYSELYRRFSECFNARDWQELAQLLSEDVALDVVGVLEDATSETIFEDYVGNYSRLEGEWRLVPAFIDGEQVLVCLRDRRGDGSSPQVAWPIRLGISAADRAHPKIERIRDYVVQAALLDEAFSFELQADQIDSRYRNSGGTSSRSRTALR